MMQSEYHEIYFKLINFYEKLCKQIEINSRKELDLFDEDKMSYYNSLGGSKLDFGNSKEEHFDKSGNKISEEFYH